MKRLLLSLLLLSAAAAFAAEDEIPVSGEDSMPASSPQLAPAPAPDEPNASTKDKKIIYRKKTTVSFDDAVVEGTINNPEGVYVVTPPEKQFGSLLKLRPNFHKELIRDSLLMK